MREPRLSVVETRQPPSVEARASAISVRRAGPEDQPIILEALAEYLPGLDVRARWSWLYEGNPHGRALTWIALDQATGASAGITSFFLRRMSLDGAPATGALGGDGYVRPAFRRLGVGSSLHAASRAEMNERGIAVMFGTPKRANITPLSRSGARSITDVVRYVRPFSTRLLSVLGMLGQQPPIPSLTPRPGVARLEFMEPLDPRIDAIWAETCGELRIATVRDAEFYTWRFLRSPSQRQKPFVVVDRGRPIGACALEIVDNRLCIIDLVAPAKSWARVFGAIAAYGRDCDVMELSLTREDGQARALWRHGFFARDTRPFNVLPPEGQPRGVIFDPRRWYFTGAETDMDHE